MLIIISDIVENDQLSGVSLKIVGYFIDRDRLVQRWVAEMLLNAQSEPLYLFIYQGLKIKYRNYILTLYIYSLKVW
jgi:hypothetical protein